MLAWIRQFLTAPVFEDEDRTRVARLLNVILLVVMAATVVGTALTIPFELAEYATNLILGFILLAIILGLRGLVRRGYLRIVGSLLSFTLWATFTYLIFSGSGVNDPSVTGYFLVIILAVLLVGARAAFVFGLLSALAVAGLTYAETSGLVVVAAPEPGSLLDLITLVTTFGLGAVLLNYAIRTLNMAFERARENERAQIEANRELQAIRASLEQRVAERTRDLQTAAEVARAITEVLDPDELLRKVVELARERFDLYYVGLFLLDDERRFAVLHAGTGEAGRQMLAQGHKLEVGGDSMIGQCVARAEARIALNVGEDVGDEAMRFSNPLLPETCSELALPLRSRGQVIGAMTVQSTEETAFDETDIAVLQTLADQVAVAIENARLFTETQQALEMTRRAYGEISRQAWVQILRAQAGLGYLCDSQDIVRPVASHDSQQRRPETIRAIQEGQVVRADSSTVFIPVMIRDHVLGMARLRKPEDGGEWTAEEIALLETLVEQLGIALESARLYQDARRRAARERLTREITDRMRRATTVEDIVQTAVDELFDVLGTSRTFVRLETTSSEQDDGRHEQ